MTSPISPQDPEVLLASLLQFGRSHDGAVERDLVWAIRDLKKRVRAAEARAERLEKALRRSTVALDDWKRNAVSNAGRYIAEVQEQNRAALAKGEAD